MLTLTANLALALAAARSADDSISRNRSLLFEVYDADAYPDDDGLFDPADAIDLWTKHDCTWQGQIYNGVVVSHSELSEFISGQFNSITLTIQNADRFLSQFCSTNVVDGLRLVVRYVSWDHSADLADSRQWVLRLEAPDNSELDREQGSLTAKEELATLDVEIPRGTVIAEDPEGRSPNDPLNEGFPFNAHQSLVKVSNPVTSSSLFGLRRRTRDAGRYNQWSSVSETDGAVVPLILGRAHMQGLPVFWFDHGFYIVGIWNFAGHKVTSITNFLLPDSSYIFYGPYASEVTRQAHVHLGDPGGTGTNATPDTIEGTYPENTWYGSRKAYVGFYVGGPESESQAFANPQMDQVATLVAIVLSEMDLPDGSGVFNQVGFSDSPVYAARFVLTSPDFFGLDSRLVNDDNLPAVHAERQRSIIDKSNGEFLALMEHDLSALVNGNLNRLTSTGLIDARYFRHVLDSAYPDPLTTNRDDAFAVSFGGEVPTGGDQQLTNSVTLAGQSVTVGNWKYYWIDIPTGATDVQFIATGSGDPHTFVRQGSKPTLTEFDDDAYTASPQTVIVDNPTAGRWWIGLYGHSGTSNYSIIAVITDGMTGNVLPAKSVVRKAWTLNLPLTDTVNAIDFLNNTVLAAARLYRVTDTAGRQDIRAKKASDSTYLISDAAIGATFVLVANVEPWRASLRGYLLINPGLTTSEYRAITSAEYHPATGNAITLTVSGTGLTRSGATLAGGSTSVPSSGTVVVSSASGDLVVIVWGIPISYTVTATDTDETVAAMLTTLINADPDLNQYVLAEWEEDDTVHIYSTVGKLIFASALLNGHESQVDSPVTAPTAAATGSGTLDPGDYYVGYSLVDGSGSETLMGPLKKITIAAGEKVSVPSLGTLPTGAAEVNWYFSTAPNDDHVQFLITNAGGSFTIDDVADYDADFPPTLNQTGGETIRVAEVFNQYNTRHGSFKWIPSSSKINQTSGEFIDAANGFKRTKVTVNDKAHQRAIKQINKKEVNLSGIDNFSQASRLLHATLADERDGGTGAKWMTDDAGIALEIGDVVAVNDYRWDGSAIENYLVNQPIFITEKTLHEDFDVALGGKVYSSSLLEGQVGRKPVVIPTTLKYLTEPPPVATSLVLTINNSSLTGFIVDFDFGSWAGSQSALIMIAGPSDTEPDAEDFELLDTVIPDGLNHGHFEGRAATSDKYWIKVITQSQFGQNASTGHPVALIDLRPLAPTDFDCLFDEVNDNALAEWETGDLRTPLGREAYQLQFAVPGDGDFSTPRNIDDIDRSDWNQYVVWDLAAAQDPPDAVFTGVDPGGFDLELNPGFIDVNGAITAKQRFSIRDGVTVQFTIPQEGAMVQSISVGGDTAAIGVSRSLEGTTVGDKIVFPLFVGDVQIYDDFIPGDRWSIVFRPDGQGQVFINQFADQSSPPIFTSSVAFPQDEIYTVSASGATEIGAGASGAGGLRECVIARTTPEFNYTADAQREDNSGSLPATIKARVRQLGFVEGGPPSDWAEATFTR